MSDRVPKLSRSRIQKLVDDGHVSVDGTAQKSSHKLRAGQLVELAIPVATASELVPEAMELEVLFEDGDLLVINKRSGVPVHPGPGHGTGTLVHGILAHCSDLSGIGGQERPGIVHRLDKDTSGAIVVAKHDGVHKHLAAQFAARSITKLYRAFTLGAPKIGSGRIETSIGRHPTDRKRFSSRAKHGKSAITNFEVVGARAGLGEIEVRIETGRTHQIRVHLSELGHPVAGDALYGGTKPGRLCDPRLRKLVAGLGRHALHAESLSFVHPMSGRILRCVAPLPDELLALRGWISLLGSDDGQT